MMALYRRTPDYLPIPTTGDNHATTSAKLRGCNRFTALLVVLAYIVGFIFGAIVFHTSASTTPSCASTTILQQPGSDLEFPVINTSFTYNRTFGADPHVDSTTEEAWESIVPLGQGSVRYPTGSPHIHTLSVIHQLHCLWSIHHGFYNALHNRSSGNAEEDASAHMRHCFDYLRQTLICASDMTLEPVNPALGGVTGWGNARVCRDYGEVGTWAEAHRVNNLRGFLHTGSGGHR